MSKSTQKTKVSNGDPASVPDKLLSTEGGNLGEQQANEQQTSEQQTNGSQKFRYAKLMETPPFGALILDAMQKQDVSREAYSAYFTGMQSSKNLMEVYQLQSTALSALADSNKAWSDLAQNLMDGLTPFQDL